ncbi:MAG: cysteine--tRNA ligase [Saprospiraceae bacterium]|nr:cysteine--tRNA ligase [Candidatus Defluviibacterium haderslevense]
MIQKIVLYNSLTREKEIFVPLIEGRVGMYVCGPTVYNDVHLGNCRTFVSFDIIYRYLMVSGYKVRYVRNITDVGHLLDDGEDRMAKGARLEQLEPMEIAHKYTNGFEEMMRIFNTLSPSIEPRATGHIIEQISMIEDILKRGYAYQQNGSVYFDTLKFINDKHSYGQLSGRIIDELLTETRDNLKNQEEKRHNSDFALWIKASEEHIMRWPSPWSIGFPGWHLECSAMSTKYLGKTFDLHGGGNDLKFPHHENEIAQSIGACGQAPSKYWLHTNMLLLNGRKMSKSEGNTISPEELFTGNSVHITKAYTPMALKFFMLQAHYRSPLDITDEALQGAEKGYKRLMEAYRSVYKVTTGMLENNGPKDNEILMLISESYQHMNDDFNVPNALASIFELASVINSVKDGHINPALYSVETWKELVSHLKIFIEGIFGLKDESSADQDGTIDGLMSLVIDLRKDIRERKDWIFADKIRNTLQELGIQLKDGKEGTQWSKL